MQIGKIVNNVILALIVLVSLLVIVSSVNMLGYKTFVVKSGSMEPAIKTGSVVISKKNVTYDIGDVITFNVPGRPDTVTHRIVEVKKDANNTTFYSVKGDANDAPDNELVAQSLIVGSVATSIPFIGYLIAFIKTLPGLIMFIIIPATVIIYYEMTNIGSEVAKIKAAKRKVVQEVEVIEDTAKEVIDELVQEEKKLVSMITKSPPKKGARHVN